MLRPEATGKFRVNAVRQELSKSGCRLPRPLPGGTINEIDGAKLVWKTKLVPGNKRKGHVPSMLFRLRFPFFLSLPPSFCFRGWG